MSKSIEDIDKIEDWLNGSLTKVESIELESRYDNDEHFRNEVNEIKQLIKGIEMFNESAIRLQLNSIEDKLKAEGFFSKTEQSSKSNSTTKWWVLAAGLAILVSGFFILSSQNSNDWRIISSEYAQLYLAEDLDRSESIGFASETSEEKERLSQALLLFEEQKFQEASIVFRNLKNYKPQSDIINWYLSLSLLQSDAKQYKSEIATSLNIVSRKDNSPYQASAQELLNKLN